MDSIQGFETWFFGGLITLLLSSIFYFLKRNFEQIQEEIKELKTGHNDHETRIQLTEQTVDQVNASVTRGQDAFHQIMTKLNAMQ